MSSTWAAENPEKWREYKREWAKRNPEKVAAYRAKWEEAKPDYHDRTRVKRSAHASAYWAANKHKMIPQSLLRAARRRAREKGMECTITLQDIVVPERCPLLDIPLFPGDGMQGPNSPSLDRINNGLGYVPGNVWVISHLANACKGSLAPDQIIQIGTRLKEKMETLTEGACHV